MAATLFTHCDARKSMRLVKDPKHPNSSVIKHTKKLQLMSKLMSLVIEQPTDTSNTLPYGVSSPFSLQPFDSLPPVNSPPYCVNPPQTPATTIPTPIGTTPSPPPPFYYFPPVLPGQSPPPSSGGTVPSPPVFPVTPNPPGIVLSPPSIFPGPPQAIPTPTISIPSPSGPILSPPYYEPGPPAIVVSPPFYVPSPFGFNPSPPVFLPPIVYPPPTVPPPPNVAPSTALWCVAKPSVPDPIIQEAMNYACASGADCDSIQPSGSCFQPDTLFAHASYAFNSYWQRTKGAGGTCEFGGTAILVTVDPSEFPY
ncbi:36.4 kDa proline-rich protein-like [Durio zibethinus]|uniref:36.4 kDa proline-rich protein-like n=1 Tax=Durio zibethinus TaxID=66656 RepID=A0A6P6A7F0_DURZI|nr:36.4 kDa proline-rich protein-like [Durio zibethinus]